MLPRRIAFLALLGGATGIGFAPILVRLSETGLVATGFFRILFALPVLWIWMLLEDRGRLTALPRSQLETGTGSAPHLIFVAAGLFFAGDLAFWHWSIRLTTVANSTFITNFAPLVVMVGARLLFRERITPALVLGMALAVLGGALMVSASLKIELSHVLGDFLALVTALFYGAYLLAVKYLRRTFSPATIMAWSGLVTCPALLLIALASHETILATTWKGWLVLLTLALVSHVAGQGLIAYAAAHLSAAFLSVSLLFQPAVAAVLAWVILGESLSVIQIAGGTVILCGIIVASRSDR